MQPRERFIAVLERHLLTRRVPHFELVFFLTMEAFAKVHASRRAYSQRWQMEEVERQLHRDEMVDICIQTAERLEHSAFFIHPNPSDMEGTFHIVDGIREKTGDRYFIMREGGATFGLPDGSTMTDFVQWLADDPQKAREDADSMVNNALEFAGEMHKHGRLDGLRPVLGLLLQ